MIRMARTGWYGVMEQILSPRHWLEALGEDMPQRVILHPQARHGTWFETCFFCRFNVFNLVGQSYVRHLSRFEPQTLECSPNSEGRLFATWVHRDLHCLKVWV